MGGWDGTGARSLSQPRSPPPMVSHILGIHSGGPRRAAGADQGRSRAGGGVLDLLVHERPDRIQLDQPLEEGGLLREPARSPLVEVVAVDEPRGEATTAVYAPGVCRCFFRRATLADGQDPFPLRHDVARGVLVPGRRRWRWRSSRGRRSSLMRPTNGPRGARRPGSSRIRCSGTGCRRAPPAPPRRSDQGSFAAGHGSPR